MKAIRLLSFLLASLHVDATLQAKDLAVCFSLIPAKGEDICYNRGRQLSCVRGQSFLFPLHPCACFPLIPATWSHPLLGIQSCAVKLVAESVQFMNLAEKHCAFWWWWWFCKSNVLLRYRTQQLDKGSDTMHKAGMSGDGTGTGCMAGGKGKPPFADSKPRCI